MCNEALITSSIRAILSLPANVPDGRNGKAQKHIVSGRKPTGAKSAVWYSEADLILSSIFGSVGEGRRNTHEL